MKAFIRLALTLYLEKKNNWHYGNVCLMKSSYDIQRWVGVVVSMSASHAGGPGSVPWPGLTKDHHKNGTNRLPAWHSCIRVGI